MDYDAVVIGAGHNALVTAIYLARAGWRVCVLEKNSVPGGAVRTAEITLPGFRHDLYATNLNLFAGSPFAREFGAQLARHGMEFVPSARPYASVFPDGSSIAVETDLQATLERMRRLNAADADAWARLAAAFPAEAEHIFPLLAVEMPSVTLAKQLLSSTRRQGREWLLDTGRLLVSSSREFTSREFTDERFQSLVAAWGMHLNFTPDMAGGALFSWLESMANQCFGMVLGKGGADNVIKALTGWLGELGGTVRCDAEVTRIDVRGGRAVAVELASGERIGAGKAIVAGTVPGKLFGDLVDASYLPSAFLRRVRRFRHEPGTLMLHLALDDLPAWAADPSLRDYAYIHIGPWLADMNRVYEQAAAGLLPEAPLLVVGQPTNVDPSRAPAGKHILWVQVRTVPSQIRADARGEITATDWADARQPFAERVIDRIAEYAPDIRERILDMAVLSPDDLQADNPNLVGGDHLAGSHSLSQNFLFRPFPGWSRYNTPIANLYMVGASTWPGGGVGAGSGRLLGMKLTR